MAIIPGWPPDCYRQRAVGGVDGYSSPMRIAMFLVPYDAGRRDQGVGLGPARLFEAGAAHQLRQAGHDVREVSIELPVGTPAHELARVVALQNALAAAVKSAAVAGEFPLVLAGNCSTAVGTMAGCGHGTAVVWLDAHADFNTPDTTTTGMLDGLALSMITGRTLHGLMGTVEGFVPVPDDQVVLVGARDLDPPEVAALAASGVRRVAAGDAAMTGTRVQALGPPVPPVYVHLDLDVLDPASARASRYAAAGGLSTEALVGVLREVGRVAPVAALAVTAYDPAWDGDGRACRAALAAMAALLPPVDPGE